MDANIITKSSGGANLVDGNVINLASPSIVELKIAPESVASFERVGNDLKMVLLDGQEVLIQNFFVKTQEGERSDLVLVDEQGVMWWGQYPEEWSQFHFTEIENHFAAFPPWLPGALGLLGVAAAAAGGGGGGSGPAANRAPVAADDEGYGLMDEPVTGNVLSNDTDPDGDPLRVTDFGIGGNTYKPGETATVPGVGELTVNEDGSYTFTPEPGFHGQVPPIEYTVEDGRGGSDKGNLNIVINAPPTSDEIAGQQGNDADEVDLDVSEHFSDADDEPLTYSAEGLPPGLEMDPETGRITGTLDSSASQGGPNGDGQYEVTVTATDPHGETTSQTFTWTVSNPPPVAEDDGNSGLVNFPLIGDVLANDSDPDGDELQVTGFTVDGTPDAFGPGETATMAGVGTLVINADGSYTFTPEPDWTGEVPAITYTVSDGEGGEDTATLTLAIDAPTVAISDNASPADPSTGDGVISSIDDRENIPLTGQVIPGGTIDSLIVTDEHGNRVEIDPADITVDADGRFSTTADLSTLQDGQITVELTVTDGNGNTGTVTDQIPQVTEAVLTIDPLLVVDGEVPVITGTGEPGGKVTLEIDGGPPVEVDVDDDGNWSYTPSAPFDPEETTIEASTTDQWGNEAEVGRKVLGLTVQDQEAADEADVLVYESALAGGSDPSSGRDTAASTFTVDTSDGDITQIVIGGGVTGGALSGGTVVTLAQLQAVAATPIAPIATEYGSITITGYDEASGVVSYTYALTDAVQHDAPPSGTDADNNIAREAVQIAVVDGDGDTRVGTFVAGVVDDVPVAVDDTDEVINAADNPSSEATGNVITGVDVDDDPDPNGSDGNADTQGADGPVTVTAVSSDDDPTSEATRDADGVLTIKGQYGELVIQPDGSYRYVPNYEDSTVKGLGPNATLTDTFTYQITDGDRDSDTATLTLTIYGVPAIIGLGDGDVANTDGSVYEANLAGGTDPDGDGHILQDSFLLVPGSDGLRATDDGPALTIQVGGETVNFTKADIEAFGTTPPAIIQGVYGEFQITGYEPGTGEVSYTYTLTTPADQSGGAINEALTLQLWDGLGNSTGPQPLNIAIIDDVPVAEDQDPVGLAEGGVSVGSDSGGENLLGNDKPGADREARVHEVTYTDENGVQQIVTIPENDSETVTTQYGELTVGSDGSWSYTSDPAIDHGDQDGVDDSFSYTVIDGDGSVSDPATQPITVTDTAPSIGTVEDGKTIDEASLPAGSEPNAGELSVSGSLGVTPAADAIDTRLSTDDAPAGLASGGVPIQYELSADGHTLTAYKGDGRDAADQVFVVTVTDPTSADAGYTFTLKGPLDHVGAGNDTELDLVFGFEVKETDSDGDAASGSFTVKVTDDVPVAEDQDPVELDEGGVTVGIDGGVWTGGTGNLITGGGDADVPGADGARIHEISYTDRDGAARTVEISEGGSQTVDTQYGQLTVHGNGDWSYTSVESADHVKPDNDTKLNDDFSYTLIDGDGDVSNAATQPITVTDTEPKIDTPTDAEVSEANLPSGSEPNESSLQASGTLGVVPGADAFTARFTEATKTRLEELELKSNGTDLTYELGADGQTITARAGGDGIFTLAITEPTSASAGYSFTLQGTLDHGTAEVLVLPIAFTVTDSDGDSATHSFNVTVRDDAPPSDMTQSVDEDGSVDFNTSADATPGNTTIHQGGSALTGVDNGDGGKDYKTAHGTVTVNPDGSITYTPDANYSGRDDFAYHTDNAGDETTTTVEMTVNPVADAPELEVGADTVVTPEDTAVALGLKAPVITDDGTGAGNNPTSERLGLITLTGVPDGAELQFGTQTHASDGNPITILLSDYQSADKIIATPGTQTLTMTVAEFEALQVTPPADSHVNFTVTMSVTSYEVDDSGAPLAGVSGATATAKVLVDVHAVTDEPGLTLEQPGDPANVGAVMLTTTPASGSDNAKIDVAINEDETLDLTSVLQEAFIDTDGSENLWYAVTGLPEGTQVVVNGRTYTAGSDGKIDTSAHKISITDAGQNPEFKITPPENYSNDQPVEASIRLNVQDSDSDSVTANPQVEHVDVDLSLRVYAVPDDVTLANPDAVPEDTTSAFLAKLGLTDTDGSETITQVRIADLPNEGGAWKLFDHGGNDVTSQVTGAGLTLVVGTGTDEYTLEQIKAFTLQPPAHSSLDGKLTVHVTTQEAAENTQSGNPESAEWEHELTVVVHPAAETVGDDSDGDGTHDLTMTDGHNYATAGAEDTWFNLNIDTDFKLADGWSNQDTSEQTFARLTPELVDGDGSQANAIGSQFQWTEGGVTKTATYGGVPIDVPVGSLGSLQFKAAPDFSGQFRIKVQAHTVDADEDGEGPVSEATSGEAWLTNILIKPVADDVTLAINGRASGREDNAIPLSIRPTSSDPSETFNITISDIPVGATVTYGSQTFTATPGNTSWTINDFSRAESLTITPPENSNADFRLKVSSESVDTLTIGGTTHTDTKAGPSLDLNVSVKGVADAATVTPKTAPEYTEADLDSATPANPVQLSDLASVALTDTDGSETLTLRISGLPEGFAPSAGTLLDPTATGADRVWVLSQSQFDSATIKVPANYSGTVEFQLTPVTTENDGDSLTGSATNLSFTVTPSPEATTTTSAELVEDVLSNIGLAIVHQNGDVDEVLTGVRIAVDQLAGKDFTLYLGDDAASAKTLAQALADGDITADSGYYVLTGEQAAQLSAQGGANLDGDLGSFDFQYQITDSHYGAVASGVSTTSDWQDASFALTATPVTDAPDASITAIGLAEGHGSTSDAVPDDDASPDTVSLTAGDTVTVTLNVASPDADGSEHVVRVVIDGVPEGVTVTGGDYLGDNQWLLVYSGSNALPIDDAGGRELPVEFVVSGYAGGIADQPITLTAQVQDRGNTGNSAAAIESDSVTWHLNTTFEPGTGAQPAEITTWAYNDDVHATEDAPIQLSELFTAAVSVTTTDAPNTFTVTLRDLPVGTEVTGMVRTVVGGQDVWSASTVVTGDTAAAQTELDALLAGITVTPPENSNENNAQGAFTFDAALTTSVTGGSDNAQTLTPTVPVDPVTDDARFAVAVDDADGQLDETDDSVALTLTVSNDADGSHGTIVDGKLYLQLSGDNVTAGGTLTVDGVEVTLQSVTGVAELSDGDYYVVEGVAMGDTLALVYTPEGAMSAGTITVDSWVQNSEPDGGTVLSHDQAVLPVEVANNGVTISSTATSGSEAANSDKASAIELAGLQVALNDADGSEAINAILLQGLPEGFLVYVGADADSATLANNAGGTGGLNTWVLSEGGDLPAYVAILPPQYWSGTLDALELAVESGETSLSETRFDTQALEPVTIAPVADGIALAATLAFGRENAIIALNLNLTMHDPVAIDNAIADGSTETVTLQLTGMGEHASFYVGSQEITSDVSYDSGSDTYTLTGLSQEDVDALGFRQLASQLSDQNSSQDGLQIGVEAWTVESGAPGAPSASVTSTVTLNVSEQFATTGNDSLLWTGEAINGLAGFDSVALRAGENVNGSDLADFLTSVEQIDLSVGGANEILGLTPEDVWSILGPDNSSGNTLTFLGNGDDTVNLGSGWTQSGTDDHVWTATHDGREVSIEVASSVTSPLDEDDWPTVTP